MIKAALFDLDGVVFETESQYSIFWGMIGREYHPEIPDFEYRIKGQTLVQIYDKYFSEDSVLHISKVIPMLSQNRIRLLLVSMNLRRICRTLTSLASKTSSKT